MATGAHCGAEAPDRASAAGLVDLGEHRRVRRELVVVGGDDDQRRAR